MKQLMSIFICMSVLCAALPVHGVKTVQIPCARVLAMRFGNIGCGKFFRVSGLGNLANKNVSEDTIDQAVCLKFGLYVYAVEQAQAGRLRAPSFRDTMQGKSEAIMNALTRPMSEYEKRQCDAELNSSL